MRCQVISKYSNLQTEMGEEVKQESDGSDSENLSKSESEEGRGKVKPGPKVKAEDEDAMDSLPASEDEAEGKGAAEASSEVTVKEEEVAEEWDGASLEDDEDGAGMIEREWWFGGEWGGWDLFALVCVVGGFQGAFKHFLWAVPMVQLGAACAGVLCRCAHCVWVLITHISSVVTLSISSAELLPRVGDQISNLLGLRIGGGLLGSSWGIKSVASSSQELRDQISGFLGPRVGGFWAQESGDQISRLQSQSVNFWSQKERPSAVCHPLYTL